MIVSSARLSSLSKVKHALSLANAYLFYAAINFVPIYVLHESVNVLGCRRTIIHLIGMLIHVQHQQRITLGNVVHVIPGPIIVKLPGVSIVSEYYPTRASAQGIRRFLKFFFPLLVTTEPLFH